MQEVIAVFQPGVRHLMAGQGLAGVHCGAAWWEVDTPDDYELHDAFKPVEPTNRTIRLPRPGPDRPSFASPCSSRYRWVPVACGQRSASAWRVTSATTGRADSHSKVSTCGEGLLSRPRPRRRAPDSTHALFGHLRRGARRGLIRNDRDLDLGSWPSRRAPAFRDRMLEHGYGVIENGHKLSVVHPGSAAVRGHGCASLPRRLGHHQQQRGPRPAFATVPEQARGNHRGATGGRAGGASACGPEGFLTAVYGDWRIP
jgi:hypothetical protein